MAVWPNLAQLAMLPVEQLLTCPPLPCVCRALAQAGFRPASWCTCTSRCYTQLYRNREATRHLHVGPAESDCKRQATGESCAHTELTACCVLQLEAAQEMAVLPEDPFGQSAERLARGSGEEASAWVAQPNILDSTGLREAEAVVQSMQPALQAISIALRDSGLDHSLTERAEGLLSPPLSQT